MFSLLRPSVGSAVMDYGFEGAGFYNARWDCQETIADIALIAANRSDQTARCMQHIR